MAEAGAWVGGFLAYEAAAAFQLPVLDAGEWPLCWFAAFSSVEATTFPHPDTVGKLEGRRLLPLIEQERYRQDIKRILAYIRDGDTYQVNHTIRARLDDDFDLATLFLALQPQHRFPYAAWLNTGEETIAAFSPELLLEKRGSKVVTAPIKGTRPRADDHEADRAMGEELQGCQKDLAGHEMIVDMARNDLGRICAVGSIAAPHLFELRRFSTVHHLESRVGGELRSGVGLDAVMAAMFPAASITGAPKRRTMEIIKELEHGQRGIYTGSLGLIEPGGDYTFNVAIRTVSRNLAIGENRIGLGGGIVADSQADAEWAEIESKGVFLTRMPEPFGLIETFLMDASGKIPLLGAHLSRLGESARRLGFACDTVNIEKRILGEAARLAAAGPLPLVMRLQLEVDGRMQLSSRKYVAPPERLRVRIAPQRMDRHDVLLRHKTTRRQDFDHHLRQAKDEGYDDVLFLNNLGLVTEGAIRAIAVRIGECWLVPPVSDGLLPSVWRTGRMAALGAVEQSLTLDDLRRADEIVMGNAVSGGRPVELD